MDVVQTPTNRKLGGTFWTLLFRSRAGIRQFQIIQEDINGVHVLCVPDAAFDIQSLKYFENKIKQMCGHHFEAVFIQKSILQETESGKNRVIISKIKTQ